ncbi:hypothetical protein [Pedobacter alpinus]|uniref:Sensor of ECF-type sigma factor n=1 Tax=Pedobacter alpinus TaxID=1590643 RepID=A0ABW5TLF3_9SPHI
MKNIITILFFALFMATNIAFAQQNQSRNKKTQQIEAIKMGFISGRLNLTDEESASFWPVYKQYQKETAQLLQQKKKARELNSTNPNKSVDDDFIFDTKILELKKKYRNEFRKSLNPEKLKALYLAERDFRTELIKQLKQRANDN